MRVTVSVCQLETKILACRKNRDTNIFGVAFNSKNMHNFETLSSELYVPIYD